MLELEALIEELKKYSELSKSQADIDLSKLRSKGEKRVIETNKRLDIILETVVRFREEVDNLDATAMDKYSNRIYEEVNSTINSIKKPETITLRTLGQYAEETRTSFLQQDQVLIKYVKLLKDPKKYGKRVKSLDRALKKLNADLSKLERFILNDYTPSASIENISLIIKDVLENIDKLEVFYNLVDAKKEQIDEKGQQIIEIENQLEKIQNHPVKIDLSYAETHYAEQQKHLESSFQNIRKALRKYDNILSKMKNKPSTTLLKEMLKDLPITLSAQPSTNGIKSLLLAVDEELKNSTLKLKRDKRKATRDNIESLINGDLDIIWRGITEAFENKQKMEYKLEELQLDEKESKIKIKLEAAKRDRKRMIEREIRDFYKVKETTMKTIEEINSKIKSTFDQNVNLDTTLVELPSWAILDE